MGIFDIFTGDPAKEAAQRTQEFLTDTNNRNQGIINSGLSTSLANIGDARDIVNSMYQAGTGAVNTGASNALGYLNTGYGAAKTGFTDLANKYAPATSTYLDSLGVNGPEGIARANAAFTPSLNYDFTLNQGVDAINRRRAAGGMLNSGNADRDALTYGQGLASGQVNQWQNNLAGFVNPEVAATTGAANANIGLGKDSAGVATAQGLTLADLAQRYGGSVSGLDSALAGLTTNAAKDRVASNNSIVPAYSQTYKNAADAEMAGSGNLWNFGLNAVKTLAGLGLPGMGGGGAPMNLGTPGGTGGGLGGLY